MVELARMRKEPLAVNYHNITPASTYDGWEPEVAADQRWARRQLANLAPRTSLGICDSGYNASELQSFGYRATAVCPVLVDMNRFGETSAATGDDDRNHSRAGHRTWLFVGRIAPHKAQHRLVQALAAYVELYGPGPVLHLVGRPGSFRYAEAVRHTAQQLGVAEMVHIVGGIGDHELGGFYRDADVFVSASVHEGFCVPIVEAMHHGVPVVAYSATAVPETVNGAALLVQRSDPEVIAAAVHSVSNDPNLRERLVRAGVERSAQLSLEPSRATMRAVLQRWVDGHGHYVAAIPEPRIAPARSASATR
jgi:glycosyltransferase involved in cell wall biosynthesis